MSTSLAKRSCFARLNPFVRRARQGSSGRLIAPRTSFQPSLEKLEDRLVLSPTLVTNTTAFPYSAVVQVITTFPKGQMQGTGTMVNQNTVLTAGHMVYDHALGGWARSIEVIPGRNGNKEPFGVAWGTADQTFNSFISDDNRNSNGHSAGDGDIGFVSLNRNMGNSTGWLGFMATSGSNYNVNKLGYPGTDGYNGTQMYYDYGGFNANGSGSVSGFGYWGWSTSRMSAIHGESGSSLILNQNGKLGIIGVQDLGPTSGVGEGYAEVTNQTVLNALASFERSHPPVAGAMPQMATQLKSEGVGVSSNPTVNTLGSSSLVVTGNDMTTATSDVNPSASQPAPSTSPVVASPAAAPTTAAQALSPLQLYLDGIILAKDLSSPGGLSTALADSALMQDIDAAGGLLNPYLDAGLLTAMSVLDGNANG